MDRKVRIDELLQEIDGPVSDKWYEASMRKWKAVGDVTVEEYQADLKAKELMALVRPVIRRALNSRRWTDISFSKGYVLDHSTKPYQKKPYIRVAAFGNGLNLECKFWPRSAAGIIKVAESLRRAIAAYEH